MENEKDLPKPELDLPLPEKELSAEAGLASKGDAFRSYRQTNIFKSKFFLGFVGLSFLIAFVIGGFALGKNSSSKQTPTPTPVVSKAPSPTPDLYTEASRSATAGWKTYTNTIFGYSFQYPNTWKIDFTCLDKFEKADCFRLISDISFARRDKHTINDFYNSHFVIFNYFQKTDNTDKYINSIINNPSWESIPNSGKADFVKTTINGVDAYRVKVYESSKNQYLEGNAQTHQRESIFFVKPGVGILDLDLWLYDPNDNIPNQERAHEIFDSIIASFKFTN